MALAFLNQGKTSVRDSLKTLVSHVTGADDNTAFLATHTGINPSGGSTSTIVKPTTNVNVDGNTFDANFTIDGTTEFTNKFLLVIGVAKGLGVRQVAGSGGTHTGGGVVGTDTISRSVRTLGIGVQSGDIFTVGNRLEVQDNS
jgi:hypothetical protein